MSAELAREFDDLSGGSFKPNFREGMRVCVLGCDPRAKGVERHSIRSRDILEWMKYLMVEGRDCAIVIADSAALFNVRSGFERKSAHGDFGEAEAVLNARLMGIRDKLFVEAIQEYLINVTGDNRIQGKELLDLSVRKEKRGLSEAALRIKNKGDDLLAKWPCLDRREVYLMSDILRDNVDFWGIFEKMRVLFLADDEFKEMVLECIPEGLRERVNGDPSYVLLQFASTLSCWKMKIGHAGEIPYDKAVAKIYEKYRESLGLDRVGPSQFEYPNVANVFGTVFYRQFGAQQPWEMELPSRETGSLSFFQGEDASDSDGFWKGFTRLAEEVIPVFSEFFGKIKNTDSLSLEDRSYLFEVEAWKVLDEILAEFYKMPRFKELLELSGIVKFLKQKLCAKEGRKKSLFELPYLNKLPFHCEPNPNECNSKLAYFLRFLGELFQGMRGAFGMAPAWEQNVYGFEIWIFWNELYAFLTGNGFPNRYEDNMWDMEYIDWYKKFHGADLWGNPVVK